MKDVDVIRSAHNVLQNSLRLKPGESLLVAGDSRQSLALLKAFVTAGNVLGARTGLLTYPVLARQNDEPPPFVQAAFAAVDAVVAAPVVSLTHTRTLRAARDQGARILVCSGLSEEMMLGSVDVAYDELAHETRRLAALFDRAQTARVTATNGMDVTVRLGDRKAMAVDGICDQPGQWNFVPAGATALAPLEGSAEGVIVFDGSLAPLGILQDPVRLVVREGRVVEIQGGRQADQFCKFLSSFQHDLVYNIAEIGVGTNPKATLSGRLIEDERLLGSVHFGIGKSLNLGGTVDAPSHTDGVIVRPTLYLDGDVIIRDGQIL